MLKSMPLLGRDIESSMIWFIANSKMSRLLSQHSTVIS